MRWPLDEAELSALHLDDLVTALHACRKKKQGLLALHIHASLCDSGLESQASLGNYLVQLLVETGSAASAHQAFRKLLRRRACSCDALIVDFAKREMPKHALALYSDMMRDGCLHPGTDAYVALLQSCTRLKDVRNGKEIHSRLGELERNLFVGNTLIAMYGKCGLLHEAQQAFEKISNRNVVSWTALIAGYAEHGHGERALELFDTMRKAGISPNAVTFVCTLKACGSVGAAHRGREIHAEVESNGLLGKSPFIGGAVIDMYAKCGVLEKARDVLDRLQTRNSVSWNALIVGYLENGHFRQVLECFKQMEDESVFPDAITYACLLSACGNTRAIGKGQFLHAEVERRDLLTKEAFVGNALLNMYAKSGLLVTARRVFDTLPKRDLVSWTALISGYAEHEHAEEALECYERLQLDGLTPNSVTYISGLKACGNLGAGDKAEEIHTEIERRGLLEEGLVGSTLVDTYSRCGSLAKAQQVLEKLSFRNVVSWTALMAGYVQAGSCQPVFASFIKMLKEGISPSVVTFVVLLTACSHCGLLKQSQTYFEAMSKDFGLTPIREHHTCMVNLLGHVGSLTNAERIFAKFPVLPDLVLFQAILVACKNLGSLKFGEWAFKSSIH